MSAGRRLRLGTRRSALALAQATDVADRLRGCGHDVELVEVVTEGDRSSALLTQLGGTGVFVTELRRRLLDGDVDLAVHSLKDLPSQPAPGCAIAAVPGRADPRDVLVSREGCRLAELPAGAVVGTGSPRRAAQLRAFRADLDVRPIRGNVDTRLAKTASGEVDAVVLAAAGLARLGRSGEVTEFLDPDVVLPAPGQGALAVECRADDRELADVLRGALDDATTRAAVTAERALLATLEAGCLAPIGALGTVGSTDPATLRLTGVAVAVDGSRTVRLSVSGPVGDADGLGRSLAARLLDAGAADLIEG